MHLPCPRRSEDQKLVEQVKAESASGEIFVVKPEHFSIGGVVPPTTVKIKVTRDPHLHTCMHSYAHTRTHTATSGDKRVSDASQDAITGALTDNKYHNPDRQHIPQSWQTTHTTILVDNTYHNPGRCNGFRFARKMCSVCNSARVTTSRG